MKQGPNDIQSSLAVNFQERNVRDFTHVVRLKMLCTQGSVQAVKMAVLYSQFVAFVEKYMPYLVAAFFRCVS